jgi:hypothetical protein
MRAIAIRKWTFGTFATLCFKPGTQPSLAAFRRKTFPGVPAASALVRTERARVSLIRMSANPILVWTRVAIFFEAKLIEQSPHASKSSGVDDGQSSVNERQQDKAVGKRNVHVKPELEQALGGVLEMNILGCFDPIPHFGSDRFFGVVQVAIQRGQLLEQPVHPAVDPAQSVEGAGKTLKKWTQLTEIKIGQSRRLGFGFGFADERFDICLNLAPISGDALVDERFTREQQARRQKAANENPEKAAEDDHTKDDRQDGFKRAPWRREMDVEEENEKAKVTGVDMDLEPGGGANERKKSELFARVEKSQTEHDNEQKKARIHGGLSQRNLQD